MIANTEAPARLMSRAPDPVILAVARCFRRLGYEGASMTLLSEATGLGRSSLYYHFPGGKEEMAQAALDRVEALLSKDISEALSGEGSWKARETAMFDVLSSYYEEGELGCLLGSLSRQDAPEAIATRVRALIQLWIDKLASFIAEQGDAEPRRRAERQVALIQGSLIMSSATCDRTYFQRALAELSAR